MSDLNTFKRLTNFDNLSPSELDILQKKLMLRKKTFDLKSLAKKKFFKICKTSLARVCRGTPSHTNCRKVSSIGRGENKTTNC